MHAGSGLPLAQRAGPCATQASHQPTSAGLYVLMSMLSHWALVRLSLPVLCAKATVPMTAKTSATDAPTTFAPFRFMTTLRPAMVADSRRRCNGRRLLHRGARPRANRLLPPVSWPRHDRAHSVLHGGGRGVSSACLRGVT